MGYMRHHAIVVTCSGYDKAEAVLREAQRKARELGCCVTEITPEAINGHRSFLVAPDGSKEGWDESDRGDEQRAALKEWLRGTCYEDGSGPLDWVEVRFGDDNLETAIVDDSDAGRRPAPPQKGD